MTRRLGGKKTENKIVHAQALKTKIYASRGVSQPLIGDGMTSSQFVVLQRN